MPVKLIPVRSDYESDQPALSTWRALQQQLNNRDGIAFYRHPLLGSSTPSVEPDFVILARGLHPLIVRCLPYRIEDLDALGEQTWTASGTPIESPLLQLGDFAQELRASFDRQRILRGRITPKEVLALPNIAKSEFAARFPDEELEDCLVIWGTTAPPLPGLSLPDQEWKLALSVIQGAASLGGGQVPAQPTAKQFTVGLAIRQLEQRIALFDDEQLDAAYRSAPGPQIVRGLAGTGKTVLLALKAAVLHAHHPDKRILFTFSTQSLYNQAERLISRFFQRMSPAREPDFDMLHVRHAWGSKDKPGVYRSTCESLGIRALSLNMAQSLDAADPFAACCKEALSHAVAPQYDFVLVDEGQDLPPEFFTLLIRLSHSPHRICFAYDQLQRLIDIERPDIRQMITLPADWDWDSPYSDGTEKDIVLKKSYRCHPNVLMLAHGLGLGLHNPTGCIQMIRERSSWEAIGYQVSSGQLEAGQQVEITRPPENSPNRVDEYYAGSQPVVTIRPFPSRDAELSYVADEISRLINTEQVRPEDIVVISLAGGRINESLVEVQLRLTKLAIKSIIPGVSGIASAEFSRADTVTLAGAFRAKGNEAAFVFIFAFEGLYQYAEAYENRNKAFVSISRSKGWVTITGSGEKMLSAESECLLILKDVPKFLFTYPQASHKFLDGAVSIQRKREVREVQQATKQLLGMNPQALDSLDPSIREELIRKLRRPGGE